MAKTAAQIREIYQELNKRDGEALARFAETFAGDERASVRALALRAGRDLDRLTAERARLEGMRVFEHRCEEEGFRLICGIDEAGRGPLAGPVVAGAVILPRDCQIFGLDDSKKLTARKREALYDQIQDQAVAVGVGAVGPSRIDQINILQADYEAMCEAIGTLRTLPQVLLCDAVHIPQVLLPQKSIIHGDARSLSIAAASVIAKVTRDRLMMEYDALYPEYGFARHKGYGTADHYAALKKYGPCPIHRRSFLKTLPQHMA